MNIKKQIALKCPILCYHHFIPNEIANMDCRTTGEKFEEDIKKLLDSGYVSISLEQLYEYEQGNFNLPEKPFIITMDDGYLSNYEIAFPILCKYNVYADIFIVTGFVGMDKHPDYPAFIPHFSFSQAEEMQRSGLVKIHSHGEFHISNIDMDKEKFVKNISKSKEKILNNDTTRVICYAYPNESFNDTTVDSIHNEGYKYQAVMVDKLTLKNIKKGCLGRVPVGYTSDILNAMQIHSNYIKSVLSLKHILEEIATDNPLIKKCNVLDDFLQQRGNKELCTIKMISYDGIDISRCENDLIIYRENDRTGTGKYGYEITVDKDTMIDENFKGNSKIPRSGFVISGHGSAGLTLMNSYENGLNVFIYEEENVLFFVQTQSQKRKKTLSDFYKIKEKVDTFNTPIKPNLLIIQNKINSIKELVFSIESNSISDEVSNYISDVESQIEELQYLMLPQKNFENRAAWYRSIEKNDDDVRKTIEKAKSLNINAIYLETWYGGKFIGFSNNPLIRHCPINGDFDALESFCRISREYDIEVHAWVANFSIGCLESSDFDENSLINKTKGKHLLDSHDNCFNLTSCGKYVYMNPYDAECRQLVLDLYKEIIEKYDVDGIHLDYIRFPQLNYGIYEFGYNRDIIEGFQKEYNTMLHPAEFLPGTQLHEDWRQFRENIINGFVNDVHSLAKALKPNIWISCACFQDLEIALKMIYQNPALWAANGWVDEVFSMSYTADNEELKENITKYKNICNGKALYSVGLSAFENIPKRIFIDQFEIARKMNVDGIALFALGNINEGNYAKTIKEGCFRIKADQKYNIKTCAL